MSNMLPRPTKLFSFLDRRNQFGHPELFTGTAPEVSLLVIQESVDVVYLLYVSMLKGSFGSVLQ